MMQVRSDHVTENVRVGSAGRIGTMCGIYRLNGSVSRKAPRDLCVFAPRWSCLDWQFRCLVGGGAAQRRERLDD